MAMRKEWTPLVEIRHEDGVAGVCRSIEGGDLLLARDLEKLSGTPIEGFEPASTNDLAGGLLPPSAVSAEAIDKRGVAHSAACANGAWVAALPDSSRVNGVPARFRDADGATVRRPLRPGATVTLEHADVRRPCPACGGRDWQIARWPWFADEFKRAEVYDFAAGVCVRCGHSEDLGGTRIGEKPAKARPGADRPPDLHDLLGTAQFPLIGLDRGWRGERSVQHWFASEGALTSLALLHKRSAPSSASLSVRSSAPSRSWLSQTEEAEFYFPSTGPPKRIRTRRRQEAEAQESLDGYLRLRQRERAAARAPHGEIEIKLSGHKVTFAIVGDAHRWGAAGGTDEIEVCLAGKNIEPSDVRLVRLRDLKPYLKRV
jgi:hypothetical protein